MREIRHHTNDIAEGEVRKLCGRKENRSSEMKFVAEPWGRDGAKEAQGMKTKQE